MPLLLDPDTVLTTLYVMVDDFCKAELPPEVRPGPAAALSRSEVVTLALFGQWERFGSERDFYRYASSQLRSAFPALPDRSQLNRLIRHYQAAVVAFGLSLRDRDEPYELLDTSDVPVRDRKRRGRGWLGGQAAFGKKGQVSFYGFRVLVAVSRGGMISGFGFGPGSAKEQPLTETFLALRHQPDARLTSAGESGAGGYYLADKGFAGRKWHGHWQRDYGATLLCPVPKKDRYQLPPEWRRQLLHLRQFIESIYAKLKHAFRLQRERPHTLSGFAARLAAKVGLHNFCVWLNRSVGRANLEFADLLGW